MSGGRLRAAPVLVCTLVGVVALAGCGVDRPDTFVPPVRTVRITIPGCGLADEIATGFAVGDGLVVTAAHPLAGTGAITVDGAAARAVLVDHRADVALLAVGTPGSGLPALRPAVVGEPVTVRRLRKDTPDSLTGSVLKVLTIRFHDLVAGTTNVRLGLVLAAEAIGGDSGAAVVGADGRVLGLIFASARDVDAQSFAVSSLELADAFAHRDDGAPVDRGSC